MARINGIFIGLLLVTLSASSALAANRLCADRVSGALRIASSCRSSEKWISNLSSLQGATGAQGQPGNAAILSTACMKVEGSFVEVLDSLHPGVSDKRFTCGAGQYAFAIRRFYTRTFSTDWSDNGDSQFAGRTTADAVILDNRAEEFLYDSQDLFVIGYGLKGYVQLVPDPEHNRYTGFITETISYKLTCCSVG